MQIAIVVYEGMTALDAIGPYEVLRFIPEVEIRFVSDKPKPIVTDTAFSLSAPRIRTRLKPQKWSIKKQRKSCFRKLKIDETSFIFQKFYGEEP